MTAELFSLAGKVAIVTGGNGGIGLGMAKGLAGASAKIFVVGRNAEKNTAAVDALKQTGVEVHACIADVTAEQECQAMAAAALQRFGRIDVLINNAGINVRKQPEEYTLEEWRTVMDTNLTSAFLCSQAVYPAMKSEGGKIINIGSMLSIFGTSFAAPYAASKGGIVQLTKSLASAWAKDNIQVNAVLPGWIDTDLTRGARAAIPTLNSRVLMRTPARRWGTPDDLSGIAVFLASRASDFITGTAIPVDGGYSSEI
jgi:2-dehydro-3-deoxy-D-gluconate 5-dehydrogenase